MRWPRGRSPGLVSLSGLNHLSDSIRGHRFEDVPGVFLTPCQGLGEVPRLLGRDVTWERGFSRVYDGLNDSWSGMGQGFAQLMSRSMIRSATVFAMIFSPYC